MMNLKIDTKEKFTVITPIDTEISAIMSAELLQACNNLLQEKAKSIVLNLAEVTLLHSDAIQGITLLQQQFYEKNASFVICCIQPIVEEQLEASNVLELWNTTFKESEAWDIVQMEEIERELMDSDDMDFEKFEVPE
ncbi:MAG: anti-sigma factor antagonist [Sphingobacteriia bacterium]|jgi:anti-anti-sigma factor|nr:MAG: anti-sigma factor antagonist [Sphingobacteriia bacterium]TAG32204.1 MAG: anti-sigma factor antagonist [Sphingobacteriia bacterium]TAH09267.1 MAG: anti-sigma factor antagonist [Sphingobacteriia bacterium]